MGCNHSDLWLHVKQASPLPQAAHIGVRWVQRVAQTNQEARKQQDGGALQSRHGPEGRKKDRRLQMDAKTQTFQKGWHTAKTYSYCYKRKKLAVYNKSCTTQRNLVLKQISQLLMLCFNSKIIFEVV